PGAPLRLVKGHYQLRPLTSPQHPGTASAIGATAGSNPSSWVNGPNYPISIAGNALAADPGSGYVYSAGGYVGSNTDTGKFYSYSPYAQTWQQLPDMPVPRELAGAAFTDGKLYVVGGWSWADQATHSQLEIYDPATRSWSAGPDAQVA